MKRNAKFYFDAMKEYIAERTPAVYNALYGQTPSQQVVDHVLYAQKSVGQAASFDDMFKADDTLSVGLTNVSGGQLPANQYFLLTAIALRFATAGGTTAADVKAAEYGLIPAKVANGEISISNNKRPIVEKIGCSVFETAEHYTAVGDTNASAGTPVTYTMSGKGEVGVYELECPKMINPQEAINVALKFAAALDSANSAIRIELIGATNVTL